MAAVRICSQVHADANSSLDVTIRKEFPTAGTDIVTIAHGVNARKFAHLNAVPTP